MGSEQNAKNEIERMEVNAQGLGWPGTFGVLESSQHWESKRLGLNWIHYLPFQFVLIDQ